MDYMLELMGDMLWQHGRFHFHPGYYRVPEQMPEWLAERAVAEGRAKRLGPNGKVITATPAVETQAQVDEPEPEVEADETESTPRRGPGRPRKTPAPENKARGRAADNKNSVD